MKRRKDLDERDAESALEEPIPKKTRSERTVAGDSSNILVDGNLKGVTLSERQVAEEYATAVAEYDGENRKQTIAMDGTPKKTTTRVNEYGTPQKALLSNGSFSTPTTSAKVKGTPRITRNANRSARRKSTRTFIERTILGGASDNEDEEDELADEIYGSEEDDELVEDDKGIEVVTNGDIAPETPSKKRGRPKGSGARQRSPSPIPKDLPPHKQYFVQNRPGRTKTSNNTLANLKLLDHEEYFTISQRLQDNHKEQIAELARLHEASFQQWQFELSQNFNICIYGWGSKRALLMKFAEHIYDNQTDHEKHRIVVINGYVPSLTLRDVFNTVALAIAEPGIKLGSQPGEMLESLISLIEEDESQEITLVINSIDRAPLRRQVSQNLLSRLSAHSQVRLIASADHPQFPLLWDGSIRSTYNFLFHECATYRSYAAEADVVDEVHELLGRSGRRVGGKDGVIFVLKSLPVNATNLFRVLIAEQLAGMNEGVLQGEHDNGPSEHLRKPDEGVEYRSLYQKAVEEFICSNDMGFRSLLKE